VVGSGRFVTVCMASTAHTSTSVSGSTLAGGVVSSSAFSGGEHIIIKHSQPRKQWNNLRQPARDTPQALDHMLQSTVQCVTKLHQRYDVIGAFELQRRA
jgi:hypothetical protein